MAVDDEKKDDARNEDEASEEENEQVAEDSENGEEEAADDGEEEAADDGEEEAADEPVERPKSSDGGASTAVGEGAPAWVVPLYVGGLITLYVGERVLSTFESGRWAVSGFGLSCVLAATAMRFIPTWQAGGERGRIERLLGLLSLVGVGALAAYLGSTEWGLEKLGLATADNETREQAEGLLTLGWVALIAVSVVPMLFAEAALYPMRNAERLESRRVRAAAASGLVLSIATIYGGLFVYSAAGAEWKADFSYFKTSEPSESTKRTVEGLNQPIEVYAFFPEVSPVRREVEGYLTALAAGVKNLEVHVHDRYLVPKLATDLKVVQDGTILIKKGEAKRTVHIGSDMKTALKKLKTLDRDFQERVYKLMRARRNIYLTVGHGEINDEPRGVAKQQGRSARILKKLLGKQHYLVKTLGLTQGLGNAVPDDADIVMVLGPTQPFAPEEIESLKRFADRGGKLFIAIDPDAVSTQETASAAEAGLVSDATEPGAAAADEKEPAAPAPSAAAPKAPPPGASAAVPEQTTDAPAEAAGPVSAAQSGLEALAAVVGVKFVPTILANDRQFVRRRYNDSDKTLLITNRFSSHASVSTLSRNSARAAVLVAGAGAVERASGASEKVDIALRAMSSTFADENRNYAFDASGEKRKSYGIAAAVTRPVDAAAPASDGKDDKKDDKKDPKKIEAVPTPREMRAFVLSDADALTGLVMSNFMTNQLLVVDAVRWLGGEESFAGEVNVEEDVRIEHTQQKDLVWFYGTIFGAPALVLGAGLMFARRSRRTTEGKRK